MKEILSLAAKGETLTEEQTYKLFESFLSNSDLSDAEIATYLLSSSKRLPATSELLGAAKSLRKHMLKVELDPNCQPLMDTCGTGGSGLSAFNTSSVVGLILAAAGVYVAKHGNRALTSKSGSADALEALGVKINLNPLQVKNCLQQTKFAFIFAPNFHPATKRVQLIRKELGVRTIFNFLGPLINPAEVKIQLLGVSNKQMLLPMAETLLGLGLERAMVVCGEDGLDEITLTTKTTVYELKDEKITDYQLDPKTYGFSYAWPDQIQGFTPEESANFIRKMLKGEKSKRRDLVLLNAACGLYLAGKVSDINEGLILAAEILDSAKAAAVLESVIKKSNAH